MRSRAFNQDGDRVLAWARWVMVQRDAERPPPEAVSAAAQGRRARSARVPGRRPRRSTAAPPAARSSGTTTRRASRSTIPAGMTIEESDHMLATRLYQNTARIHFDARA